MRNFSNLLLDLENAADTSVKIDLLVSYFRSVDNSDKISTITIFTKKRPKRQVKARVLTEWAIEESGIQRWLFDECYNVVGDFSETISLILADHSNDTGRSLTYWIRYLQNLEGKDEYEKKLAVLEAWRQLDSQSILIFNKLITGGFRVNVTKNLIIRALASLTGKDQSEIAYRLMADWDPDSSDLGSVFNSEDAPENISAPYPFCQAYPLTGNPSNLGKIDDWVAEWKWDGIRVQLIKRKGRLFIWSKEDLVTDKFPELHSLAQHLPDGVAIDGELLPFKDGHPLPSSILRNRIKSKNVTKKMLKEAPAVIKAYDLLELDHRDIRDTGLVDRRTKLEELVNSILDQDLLQYSHNVRVRSWKDLDSLRKKSRTRLVEGLVLKHKKSAYHSDAKRGEWWKWNADPFSIHVVLMYVQIGRGQRIHSYTDYTFGVRDGNDLVPIAKVVARINDNEIWEINSFIEKNTLERFGPTRAIKPELVFELHFRGVQPSGRHKSGILLLDPEIYRWCREKKVQEVNLLTDLKQLIQSNG